ncbi:hypothetical protein NP493_6056g00018 [Ridgeia piscesae]|uniref:Uncharacterized protein n=1 Tax=Ridgeia piscesae TaxID=27915 RepID=A0AAD9MQT7_RIDPI|nr:hypothetical protein NP493_6056g00018 [Ridgeia piscesae]
MHEFCKTGLIICNCSVTYFGASLAAWWRSMVLKECTAIG